MYATLRTKIRHPSTDYHRHNEIHATLALGIIKFITGMLPFSNTLPVRAETLPRFVSDWILETRRSRSRDHRPGQSWSQRFSLAQSSIGANRLMRGSPSDGGICETVFFHVFRTVDVPQINHHGASHQIP